MAEVPVADLADAARRRLRVLGVEVEQGSLSVGEPPQRPDSGPHLPSILFAIGCGTLFVLFLIGGVLNLVTGIRAVGDWMASLFGG